MKSAEVTPSVIRTGLLPKASWKIDGKTVTSFDDNVIETTDYYGKTIFVQYKGKKIDNSKWQHYEKNIEKGVVSGTADEGLVLVSYSGSLKGFKVKSKKYGDFRLFGNEIYSNPNGDWIFVLKYERDHSQLLPEKLKKLPTINILQVPFGDEFENEAPKYPNDSISSHSFACPEYPSENYNDEVIKKTGDSKSFDDVYTL